MDFMAVNGSPKPAKGETNGAKKSNAGKKQPTGDSVTRKKFMQVCLAFQSFKKDGKVRRSLSSIPLSVLVSFSQSLCFRHLYSA